MGCSVRELLDRTSSLELSEWLAFSTLEPFGAEAEYVGHAITSATIANVNRGKDQREYKVEDFMPKLHRDAQTPEQMLQFAEMMNIGLRGEDLREDTSEALDG